MPPQGDTATYDFTGHQIGGSYLLLEAIGGGATGTVWRALDRATGDTVAVKLLREDLMRRPKMVTRFIQEREILLRLTHPHIVRVRDMPTVGSTLGLVMDFVDGGNLRDHLRERGTLPPAEAATLLAQVAEALVAAHAGGVVHRDLKPDNILLHHDPGGGLAVRLTDFGIARVLDAPGLTTPEALIGTPNYMAPEIIDGRHTSPAVDVYALGVVLFELIVGRQPFAGGSAIAVLRRHVDYLPPRVPGMPEHVTRVVEACLDKRAAKRPSAVEMVTSLRSLARRTEGVAALPPVVEESTGSGAPGRAGSLFWSDDLTPVSGRWYDGSEGGLRASRGWGLVGVVAIALSLAFVAYLLGARDLFPDRATNGALPTAGSATGGGAASERLGDGIASATAGGRPDTPAGTQVPLPVPAPVERAAAGVRPGTTAPARTTAEVPVYGPWQCADGYTWDIGHPVVARPCHAIGVAVRLMGRLQGLPGVQADVTLTLLDARTGVTAAGPFRCTALLFTDFTPEHRCGPFEASPRRGQRYVLLQQWRYTGRTILPGGQARGHEFTW